MQAFNAYIASLPSEYRNDIELRAYQNAFAVEVYNEYKNDAERWEVALSTAKMLVDTEYSNQE